MTIACALRYVKGCVAVSRLHACRPAQRASRVRAAAGAEDDVRATSDSVAPMRRQLVREGDTLIVHSLDRLARNVDDLRRIVRELNQRGVSVEFIKNRLNFSGGADPTARLMLTMLGAFAEFERELIRERQREGIAIAKAKGVYKGRKKALGAEMRGGARRKGIVGETLPRIEAPPVAARQQQAVQRPMVNMTLEQLTQLSSGARFPRPTVPKV